MTDPLKATMIAAGSALAACFAAYATAVVLLVLGYGWIGVLVALAASFFQGFATRLVDHVSRMVTERER